MKVIKFDLLPWEMLVSIGDPEEKVIKYLKNKLGYSLDKEEIAVLGWDKSSKYGTTIQFKNKTILLWVKEQKPSYVAHEAFHAATFILESAGLKFSQDSDEMWAYLFNRGSPL